MKCLASIILFPLLASSVLSAGNFPQEAWGKSYLKDIPRAVAFVETHAAHLAVQPPPEDDSETTRSELEHLKKLAENRKPEDIIRITKEHLDPYKRFFEVLEIDQRDYPRLDNLIHYLASESYFPVLYFKHRFSRIRPYQIDTSLETVIDGPPHASYPSGHATQAYLIALVLSEALPRDDSRSKQLTDLGKNIGIRREIAGVHYPSDTQAGVELAKQLYLWIQRKPEFKQLFEAAKHELGSN